MILWGGACHVHEKFSKEGILELKKTHPEAKVVVHPECRGEVADLADYCGSTAGILSYCGESDCNTFIVVTEPGILAEMEKKYPTKKFIPAPSIEGKACNECEYMKMITLDSIIACLENGAPTIELDEETRQKASKSIEAMVKVG
jgi:quinolinate synthase